MSEAIRTRPIEAPRQKLGRYELVSELASGGMGLVYLGRLQGVGGFERLFAIKVLHAHLARKPEIVSMLLNEARLAAQIRHPNVVSTVDADLASNGQYYVVMEYVDGFTLCELLDHPRLDAVRRLRLGLRILLDATAGLDAAHRLRNPCDGAPLGIVHRDVSPTNILVSLEGTGLIADFGIARATAAHDEALPGMIKGTPCYMAPEQLAGSEALDARADVFSLGAVLWEVLTGEQLFYSPAGVGGVLALVQNSEIAAPSCRNSRVPEALDAICLKALQRDVDRRHQSARELFEELERVAREHDLIASTHEVAEALSGLFSERIAQRRAALPAADVSSSALVAIPEALRASAPPPAGARPPAGSAEGRRATGAEVAEALAVAARRSSRRRLAGLAAGALAALLGLAFALQARVERAPEAQSTALESTQQAQHTARGASADVKSAATPGPNTLAHRARNMPDAPDARNSPHTPDAQNSLDAQHMPDARALSAQGGAPRAPHAPPANALQPPYAQPAYTLQVPYALTTQNAPSLRAANEAAAVQPDPVVPPASAAAVAPQFVLPDDWPQAALERAAQPVQAQPDRASPGADRLLASAVRQRARRRPVRTGHSTRPADPAIEDARPPDAAAAETEEASQAVIEVNPYLMQR